MIVLSCVIYDGVEVIVVGVQYYFYELLWVFCFVVLLVGFDGEVIGVFDIIGVGWCNVVQLCEQFWYVVLFVEQWFYVMLCDCYLLQVQYDVCWFGMLFVGVIVFDEVGCVCVVSCLVCQMFDFVLVGLVVLYDFW